MSMRSGPASRDPNFRGIDPAALSQVIQQLQQAAAGVQNWLSAHPAPAGVSSAGYTQALSAQQWIADQIGMLTRRRAIALSQQDNPDIKAPAAPDLGLAAKATSPNGNGQTGLGGSVTAGLGNTTAPGQSSSNDTTKPPRPDPVVPKGAGSDLGSFTTTNDAIKAAVADAYAANASLKANGGVATGVWKDLARYAEDPEYTAAYYERLGPAGIARLIKAADGDEARLKTISESLSTADHQLHMNAQWVAAMLTEADRLGDRAAVTQVVKATPLAPRLDDALKIVDSRRLAAAAKAS